MSAEHTRIGGSPNQSSDGPSGAGEQRLQRLRIVPHIVDVRKDLFFEVMDREVPENTRLKVGRFTEKVSQQMNRIAFKSKVVSRSHAEVWVENGQFYIQDTKSSSGTFLNHMRLSPPGVESRPHPLHDGDILQLGVDYQGGMQDIYKCVKIRLEINRDWQRNRENPYRQQVLANIQNAYHANSASGGDNNECCICLYQMVAFQALFLAPCSHCFHYKCVKPLLFTSTGFNCPLCRTYADLEASVTIDENEMDIDAKPPILPSALTSKQQQMPSSSQPASEQQAAAAAAAAAAEDAVRAAEAGSDAPAEAHMRSIGHDTDALAERDDANATPVPAEQANVESFGSTPVESLPTNLALRAGQGDADASLVGAAHGEDSDTGSSAMQVASPPLPASDSTDACIHRHSAGSPQGATAAAPGSSEA
ncbi:hypothetical protein EV183_004047 [Coemansia sp. RSA 2336]|nr:hypothetical protein EV183_004047 [Coemansia sp. RSA 2336]